MSNTKLKIGQSSPTHDYLLRYSYEVSDHPYMEDGDDNWICDGEISTSIDPDLFKDACDDAEGDGSTRYPETNLFDDILWNTLCNSDVDTSNWENWEFISATPFDKRKRSWG